MLLTSKEGGGISMLADLEEYLEQENIHYDVLQHPLAYEASKIAHSQHVPGSKLAKTVFLKCDDEFCLAVVPADHMVDFDAVSELLGADNLDLATEREMAELFPECDVGAAPPFGNWHDLPVWADISLADNKNIYFNAGSHTELVKMSWSDYKKLVNPRIEKIGTHL